jgi:ribonuclease Z
MRIQIRTFAVLAAMAVAILMGYLVGAGAASQDAAHAAEPKVETSAARGVYYPNTEELAKDEMRIISCGTGMPNQRPSQAASCWLVELGNGEKFIFDIGTASADNLAALLIPQDYLDKLFISHLHTDHFGDFGAIFVGGLINGRTVPLRVWGPSGDKPERGTKYAMDHWRKALTWDVDGRAGRLPASGQGLEVTEFDYKGENQVVYQENGLDGPVSYSLEWNGLRFVFGGDTYPNTWFPKYAKNADVVVHECFITVPDLVDKMNFPIARALNVGTQIHTAPPAFGKVMSLTEPRMAIAYHFFNDFDTSPKILEGIKQTYSGPLTLADDMMVWNVTKDKITVRDIVFDENVWSPKLLRKVAVDRSIMLTESEWTRSHAMDMGDIIKGIYDRANKLYGTNEKPDL